MSHIPYGYQIQDGIALPDPVQKEKIHQLIKYYLSGESITNSIQKSKFEKSRSVAERLLFEPLYLGDDYYPPLISQELHEQLIKERQKRYEAQGNFVSSRSYPVVPVYDQFIRKKEASLSEDSSLSPAEKAAFVYQQIESVKGKRS